MSICPAYYHPVAFRGRCAQVLQIYGNGKLYDPHFQETILPISVHPSMYIWLLRQNWVSHNNFMLADKSTCEKLCFCFEMKLLHFLGIPGEIPSVVEVTKEVQPKILDHKFLKLLTIQAPLFAHAGADTQALFTQCLPARCMFFVLFNLFRYSLIAIHSVRGKFNKNSSGSHYEYFLVESTHVLSLMVPDKCGIDEDLYKQPFVSQ